MKLIIKKCCSHIRKNIQYAQIIQNVHFVRREARRAGGVIAANRANVTTERPDAFSAAGREGASIASGYYTKGSQFCMIRGQEDTVLSTFAAVPRTGRKKGGLHPRPLNWELNW